ncbi:MAG: hypothetical protein FWD79_08090 [Desulfobulbus sp.]|nr:hypothetical protein [Desulfobulbus sp.]
MKKSFMLLLSSMFVSAMCCQALAGEDTHVGQAVKEGVQASGHASGSAAHALVASGQVTSAAASVPLAISGQTLTSAGVGSSKAAIGLQQAASAPVRKPLEITDESISTTPPDQALQR